MAGAWQIDPLRVDCRQLESGHRNNIDPLWSGRVYKRFPNSGSVTGYQRSEHGRRTRFDGKARMWSLRVGLQSVAHAPSLEKRIDRGSPTGRERRACLSSIYERVPDVRRRARFCNRLEWRKTSTLLKGMTGRVRIRDLGLPGLQSIAKRSASISRPEPCESNNLGTRHQSGLEVPISGSPPTTPLERAFPAN